MSSRSPQMSLKVRKEVLQKIKQQVRLYLGDEPPGLRRYALAYKKDIERMRWKTSNESELFAQMAQARVIVGGDFHAYSQAQRVHLRHLRQLLPQHKVVLAVECIESRYQKFLDEFMAGTLSEKAFLQKVQWSKSWGFSWEHYKPLFELLRSHGGYCLALNKKTPATYQGLRARDHHAVQVIKKALKKCPTDKIYVIYGDLHVAQKHLPSLIQKQLGRKPAVVSLYLNPEKVYFQLLKKNKVEQVRILRFQENQFCQIESPPWVKWQSYLLFLEETLDLALEEEGRDYSEHIATLLQIMSSDFAVKISTDVSVASFSDNDFLDVLHEKLQKEHFVLARRLIESDISFFEPQTQRAYLARGTVNYAAHLAGLVFHSRVSKEKSLQRVFPQDFEKVIWHEAVAFFLSKAINPHRKAMSMGDLKKQLAAFSPRDHGERALKLALDQKMKELLRSYSMDADRDESRHKMRLREVDYYNASRILGAMLGEKIHQLMKTGRLSREQLLEWIKMDMDLTNFDKIYIQILRELDRLEPVESELSASGREN